MGACVMAIDQGTTGTTVLLVDRRLRVLASVNQEFRQHFPRPGRVEHDLEEIWASVLSTVRRALRRAIVWQDRRTADACARLKEAGREPAVKRTTGLVLDPYFSATKVRWLLDHAKGIREKAESGAAAFGTVDTFLTWRLTGGAAQVTHASHASRPRLLDLESL